MVDYDVVEAVERPSVEIVDQSLRRGSAGVYKHESRRTGQVTLSAEEDLVLVPAAAIAILDNRERVLHDLVVLAIDRVDLHRLARLVIGSEIVAIGLLDVYTRLMSKFVGTSFDQSQRWLSPDHVLKSRVVDDERRAFCSERREVLWVGRGGFPTEFGYRFVSRGSRHFVYVLCSGRIELSGYEDSRPLGIGTIFPDIPPPRRGRLAAPPFPQRQACRIQ